MKGVPGLNKDEIVAFIADMFRTGMLADDPGCLGLSSKEEYDPDERCNADYYNELALQYLDFTYNNVSQYSANENLLYMAGRYSALK